MLFHSKPLLLNELLKTYKHSIIHLSYYCVFNSLRIFIQYFLVEATEVVKLKLVQNKTAIGSTKTQNHIKSKTIGCVWMSFYENP